MHLERYTSFTTDYQDCEFYSDGPKGRIKKTVMFTKAQGNPTIYNLAFGDVDPHTGIVSDIIISDNKDRDKVLATVANAIHAFCNHYGNYYICTRQHPGKNKIIPNEYYPVMDEISIDFEVHGVIDNISYEFQKNVNYEGFLVKRK